MVSYFEAYKNKDIFFKILNVFKIEVLKIANKIVKSDDWIKHAQEIQNKPNAPSHSNTSSNTANASKPSQDDGADEFEDGLL